MFPSKYEIYYENQSYILKNMQYCDAGSSQNCSDAVTRLHIDKHESKTTVKIVIFLWMEVVTVLVFVNH